MVTRMRSKKHWIAVRFRVQAPDFVDDLIGGAKKMFGPADAELPNAKTNMFGTITVMSFEGQPGGLALLREKPAR